MAAVRVFVRLVRLLEGASCLKVIIYRVYSVAGVTHDIHPGGRDPELGSPPGGTGPGPQAWKGLEDAGIEDILSGKVLGYEKFSACRKIISENSSSKGAFWC